METLRPSETRERKVPFSIRAKRGEREAETIGFIRSKGKDLVNLLFVLFRNMKIYDYKNEIFIKPTNEALRVISELLDIIGTFHLIGVEGQAYINDIRIRLDSSSYNNVLFLLSELEKKDVGGLTFNRPPDIEILKRFIYLLVRTNLDDKDPGGKTKVHEMRRILKENNIVEIELDSQYKFSESDRGLSISRDSTKFILFTFAKAMIAVKDFLGMVKGNKPANPLRLRKIVHDLVDISLEDFYHFMGLTTVKYQDDPFFNHSVNVCNLSVAVGRKLNLNKVELGDLGVAGIFHDVGYAHIPEAIKWKETLSEEDKSLFKNHPILGLRIHLKQKGFHEAKIKRLLSTFEHHLFYDMSDGFPPFFLKGNPFLFSRIINIADYYDLLTTPRGNNPGITPARAIELMKSGEGTLFDPNILGIFINLMGRYPFGSLVELNTGERAVVSCGGREEEKFELPIVILISDSQGNEIPSSMIDLAEDSEGRRIEKILNPYKEMINVSKYLIREEEEEVAAEEEVMPSEELFEREFRIGEGEEEDVEIVEE